MEGVALLWSDAIYFLFTTLHTPRNPTYVMNIDLQQFRAPEKPSAPTPAVVKWWSGLAPVDRPLQLAKQYPRVLNKIVASWHDDLRCERLLSELVIDTERYDRQGFPFEVMMELLALEELRRRPQPAASQQHEEAGNYAREPG
jgi:hypothetical protein